MIQKSLDPQNGISHAGHSFYEASSPRKIHGKYYLVYSSILSHELCYAISDFPDRDYCYGGTLVSIGDVGLNGQTQPVNYTGNTHGGMVQVEDQWYIFYHRQTNKQMCARQACAEKITILPNGTIPQAEITSCGLNVGPLRGKGEYDARIACNLWAEGKKTFAYLKAFEEDKERIHPYFTQSGEDREGKGDQYISNMRNGATAGFKYFSLDCLKSITIRVRGEGNGQMEVRIRPGSEPFASVAIQQQCQWQDFTARVSTEIVGTQALYFTYTGEGYVDFTAFTLE